MKQLSLRVAVLIAALLIANLQCLARCASQPCGNPTKQSTPSQVPPCHRDQQPKDTPPAAECDYATLSVTAALDMVKSGSVEADNSFMPVPQWWAPLARIADGALGPDRFTRPLVDKSRAWMARSFTSGMANWNTGSIANGTSIWSDTNSIRRRTWR